MYDEGEPHPERGLEQVLEALAPYGLRPEFQTLFICTTCLELFDVIDVLLCRREKDELQQCLCHRVHKPTWPRYDYNEKARLCDCCGREVLRSGSRWSVWFCEECNQRVRALNGRLGFTHIPVGRHSLMNNFALSGPAIDDAGIERFVERFEDMSDHIGWVLVKAASIARTEVSVAPWYNERWRGEGEPGPYHAKGERTLKVDGPRATLQAHTSLFPEPTYRGRGTLFSWASACKDNSRAS